MPRIPMHTAGLALAGALAFACASDDEQQRPEPQKTPAQQAEEESAAASARLAQLAQSHWDIILRSWPETATLVGDHRYDDKLADLSPTGAKVYADQVKVLQDQVEGFAQGLSSETVLDEQERITLAMLRTELREALRSYELERYTFSIDQMGGPQADFAYFITQQHPKATPADIENLIARYRAFPAHVDGLIKSLKQGLAKGRTAPKLVVERILQQLDGLIGINPAASPFALVAKTLPDTLSPEDRTRLSNDIVVEADKSIRQTFVRYRAFLHDEYAPKARDTIGVSALDHGADVYAHLAQHHTTTAMTAEEIHQIGLDELARIEAEMKKLADQRGHQGDVASFLAALRADKANYATSRDALLESFKVALARADQALPSAFGTLPKLPYEVKPLDPQREKDAPAAYYQPGSQKDGRPGVFVANLYRFEDRPLFNSSVLSFHEAVPGHHLQIAIAQEVDGLPTFRKEGGVTAFVEGWGLYAERLSDELGLYPDLESRVGYLGFAAWRASRLVIDTGIHAKGWTRQHAIDFLGAHSTLGPIDVVNEVDRYIAWPGQALAYMVGCLKILDLREKAKAKAGAGFDIKAFHDVVLLAGPVPLTVLEARVQAAYGL